MGPYISHRPWDSPQTPRIWDGPLGFGMDPWESPQTPGFHTDPWDFTTDPQTFLQNLRFSSRSSGHPTGFGENTWIWAFWDNPWGSVPAPRVFQRIPGFWGGSSGFPADPQGSGQTLGVLRNRLPSFPADPWIFPRVLGIPSDPLVFQHNPGIWGKPSGFPAEPGVLVKISGFCDRFCPQAPGFSSRPSDFGTGPRIFQ